MIWQRDKAAVDPSNRIHPDDIAPSAWERTREVLWQFPRFASAWGPIEPTGPEEGPPALVLPGFLSSDRSTSQIRGALGRYGWRAHPWELGTNKGAYHGLLETLEERLDAVGDGRKVLVLGWSLGGLYARELARHAPDKVRAVVTLASPFCGDLKSNNNVRWLYEWVAGHDVNEPPFPRLEDKPPVPTMAFWSRRDGIVAPRAARGDECHSDRAIEIDTHHMGFAVWRPALSRIMAHVNRFVCEVEGEMPARTRSEQRAHERAEKRARRDASESARQA
ncbi:alpha/beta hydrolase family protein [Sphingomicrobium aestuariivivum]|uniref:alpha/beta hydrolase family protein n=1 Tax=Sphingomicrobium aestuariivivum TaxID=1582356 RepID=UPI001FD681D1|nr:alpha/beta hydrolase [Sphingomicrobium aestuariivivum]MCJ8191310.1 alpha/beta hydrolase [Sphingomicrobium aestuariivivum]